MVQGGDEFTAFVASVQSDLQRSAWLLTGTWEEAEDLVALSLVKVWGHWDRVSVANAREAYARRILVNVFLSSRRRLWNLERPHAAPEPPAVKDPSDSVAVRATIGAALAALSARQRAAVVLRFFDDLPEAQVAEIMGCRIGTVKSTTARAVERLRATPGLRGLFEEVQQ